MDSGAFLFQVKEKKSGWKYHYTGSVFELWWDINCFAPMYRIFYDYIKIHQVCLMEKLLVRTCMDMSAWSVCKLELLSVV